MKAAMIVAYGEDTPAESTIRKWFRHFEQGNIQVCDHPRSGRPRDEDFASALVDYLEQEPYTSAHRLADLFNVAVSTVTGHLEGAGLKYFNLRWVPHVLSDEQKKARVDDATALLHDIERLPSRGPLLIVTSDESWFLHDNPHSEMWCESRDDVATRPSPTIARAKTLVAVFWNFRGFHYITAVSPDQKYNSEFCTTHALPGLDTTLCESRPKYGARGISLHWDSARPHTAKATRVAAESLGVKFLPHPPYSLDLAPSDFFLFGYPKEKIKGEQFTGSDDILCRLRVLMEELNEETLLRVYENWKIRLLWVAENSGECYPN